MKKGIERIEKIMTLLNEVDKEISLLLREDAEAEAVYSKAMFERNDMEHLIEHIDTDKLSEQEALTIVKETNRIRRERRDTKLFMSLMEKQEKTLSRIQVLGRLFTKEMHHRIGTASTNYHFRTPDMADLYSSLQQVALPFRKTEMKLEHFVSPDAEKHLNKITKGRMLTNGHELSNRHTYYISKEGDKGWVLKDKKKTILRKKKFSELLDVLINQNIYSVAMGRTIKELTQNLCGNKQDELSIRTREWLQKAERKWMETKENRKTLHA